MRYFHVTDVSAICNISIYTSSIFHLNLNAHDFYVVSLSHTFHIRVFIKFDICYNMQFIVRLSFYVCFSYTLKCEVFV